MYNQPFSSLWIFDRCQEIGSAFFTHPFFVTGVWIFLALYFIFFVLHISVKIKRALALAVVISSPVFLFFYFFAMLFMGYVVFNCSASSRFWSALEPSVQLNAKLNHLHFYNLPLPRTEDELKAQFPEDVEVIAKSMPYSYTYDASENRYTFLVRPSEYIVTINDSKIGQRMQYVVPHWWNPAFIGDKPVYPPVEPGPWERLPQ